MGRFADQQVTHLLSLEDPGTPKETPSWFKGPHVQLHFHDVDRTAEASAFGAVAPVKAHVAEILRFGAGCLETATVRRVHLLVHCHAGISRSTAAAFALTVQAIGAERAADALQFVLTRRPEAYPNPLIVLYADRLLKGDGRLVDALQELRGQFNQIIDEWLARD